MDQNRDYGIYQEGIGLSKGRPYAFFVFRSPERIKEDPVTELERIEREWESAHRFGTAEERVSRARAWLPYYSWLLKDRKGKPFDPEADPAGFVSFLTGNGLVNPDDTLLDIGAGGGDYSLRFARRCREVTALELNPDGVALIRERADLLGIGNLRTVHEAWELFRPEEPYGVTFVSMCPAICNVEEIRRMEDMTRHTCCIVTVKKGSYDFHRKQMMNELGLHPKGMITDADRYLSVLGAMGRDVITSEKTLRFEYDVPERDFCEKYPVYFSVFGMPRETSKPYVKQYFKRHAGNGVLHDESELHLVLLAWNGNRS